MSIFYQGATNSLAWQYTDKISAVTVIFHSLVHNFIKYCLISKMKWTGIYALNDLFNFTNIRSKSTNKIIGKYSPRKSRSVELLKTLRTKFRKLVSLKSLPLSNYPQQILKHFDHRCHFGKLRKSFWVYCILPSFDRCYGNFWIKFDESYEQ